MKFTIKHRYTNAVIFELECETIRQCLESACKAKTDLRGVDLSDTDLRGVDLRDTDLRGVDLSYTDLRYTDLRGANLSYTDLRGANLSYTDLRGVDLSYTDLRDTDLRGANGKALPRATPEESIANLDKVREIILDNDKLLEMGHWHASQEWLGRTCEEEAVCGTTHCLAGWLQVCATDPGIRKIDAHLAGILQAPVASKMFFRGNDEVRSWLETRTYVSEVADAEKRKAERAAKVHTADYK